MAADAVAEAVTQAVKKAKSISNYPSVQDW